MSVKGDEGAVVGNGSRENIRVISPLHPGFAGPGDIVA
jgi:hypothetical protein